MTRNSFIREDSYCPNCGVLGVWVDTKGEDDDYYYGFQYLCTSCKLTGVMWHGRKLNEWDYGRLHKILKKLVRRDKKK